MSSNIVHHYFKKDQSGSKILMKVDVLRLKAIELIVSDSEDLTWNEIDVEENVLDQLREKGFQPSGPLEFNLYDAGLAGRRTE